MWNVPFNDVCMSQKVCGHLVSLVEAGVKDYHLIMDYDKLNQCIEFLRLWNWIDNLNGCFSLLNVFPTFDQTGVSCLSFNINGLATKGTIVYEGGPSVIASKASL